MARLLWIVIIVLVLGYLGVQYFLEEKDAPELAPISTQETTLPALPPKAVRQPEAFKPSEDSQLPTYNLNESDAFVHQFIQQENPSLLQWLSPKDLIRRFVININAIAKGNTPTNFPLVSYKIAPFKAIKNNSSGKLTSDPSNDVRVNPLVLALTSIPTDQLIGFYQHYQPLFEEAYQELGQADSFETALIQALDNIIQNPTLPKTAELAQHSVSFQYKSSPLEKASSLDKALWRLGRQNNAAIKQYALKLKEGLQK